MVPPYFFLFLITQYILRQRLTFFQPFSSQVIFIKRIHLFSPTIDSLNHIFLLLSCSSHFFFIIYFVMLNCQLFQISIFLILHLLLFNIFYFVIFCFIHFFKHQSLDIFVLYNNITCIIPLE